MKHPTRNTNQINFTEYSFITVIKKNNKLQICRNRHKTPLKIQVNRTMIAKFLINFNQLSMQ